MREDGVLENELNLRSLIRVSHSEKRSLSFLIGIGLFGLGLSFTLNLLDPFIYTEKVQSLAPTAIKNSVLGFITIMTLLVALIAQPLVGQWSDRTRSSLGRRAPYLIWGVIGLSLSLFLVVFAPDLWLLLIAAMLASAFSNTVQGPWQALIPDQVPESQHGTAAGIKTLLELIGAVAGVAVVGLALAKGNLWMVPLVAVGLFALILPLTLRTLAKTPVQLPLTIKPSRTLISFIFKHKWQRLPGLIWGKFSHMPPAFLWWMLNRFLFWAAAIALRTFLLNYLQDVFSLSLAQAQELSSQLFLFLGVGVFLLALPAGAVADRVGRRPLLIGAGLMAASGASLFIFRSELELLFIAGGLIGGAAGIYASASWALVTDVAPKGEGAFYLGLANGATVLGSISGRMGGPVIDGVNYLTGAIMPGYLVVFGIAALFFLGSSLIVLKIPEAHQ